MAIGISPTVDFAFKLLLGSPEHTSVTIHFLNAVLSDQPRITHVEILNPFLGKKTDEDKLSVLDVLARDEHGRMLNIEMQTTTAADLRQRLLYYAATLYTGQLTEGSSYATLRPAISICVLTQALKPVSDELHRDFRLREQSGTILTSDLQIHFLELSKLRVSIENVSRASAVERWAFFLKHAERLSASDICRLFPDPEMKEAAGVLEMISQTFEQRLQYIARLKAKLDEEWRLNQAKQIAEQGWKDGMEAGREAGMQAGMLEGRQAGMQEGRQAGMQEGREAGIQEGLQSGMQAGREAGLSVGIMIGRIQLLQQVLGVPVSTAEEFSGWDESRLSALEAEFQSRLNR
jgi:predicted transposase/invertase (TIGR01784 family)